MRPEEQREAEGEEVVLVVTAFVFRAHCSQGADDVRFRRWEVLDSCSRLNDGDFVLTWSIYCAVLYLSAESLCICDL